MTMSVPYESTNSDVKVFIDEKMMTLQTAYFIVRFDGVQFFQFSRCGLETFCGLCGIQLKGQFMDHPMDISKFLLNDSTKPYCTTNNMFPNMA